MINNRQGARRRGRNGQRPPGITGRSDGNRQDNRQRGNAAQLLEKYKALARDSQLAGDRVQTEYYLQFAEHYFRVLGESQARFDEQRRARGEDLDDGYDGDGDMDGDLDEDGGRDEQPERAQQQQQPRRQYEDRGDRQQQPRADRYERNDRPQRAERNDRPERQERAERTDRPERQERPVERSFERAEPAVEPERMERNDNQERVARPPRERSNGRARPPREELQEERIAFDVIPPAIGPVEEASPVAADEENPRPRRRVRRTRPEGEAEVAPAA